MVRWLILLGRLEISNFPPQAHQLLINLIFIFNFLINSATIKSKFLRAKAMIQITPIPAFKDNYIWLIHHPKKSHAVIVDPGVAEPVLATLKAMNLKLSAILITHHHYDHCHGIEELLQVFPVPVYGPHQGTIAGVTQHLYEGDRVNLPELNLSLSVFEIPGHTLDHIAYFAPKILFCGDTLFTAGCGRLFEGTAEQMVNSLDKLAALPSDTLVYCGHEYTKNNLLFAQAVEPNNNAIHERLEDTETLLLQGYPTVPASLAVEKKTNPFLRFRIPEIKNSLELKLGCALNNPVEIFAALRNWKNNFQ